MGQKEGVHPEKVAFITGTTQRDKQTPTLTFIPMEHLKLAVQLTCMSLGRERKSLYPERTHVGAGKTCKLTTERPGSEPNP